MEELKDSIKHLEVCCGLFPSKRNTSSLNRYKLFPLKHAIKEQDKQAKGYNRKIKCTHINIGDGVLIANSGERGKKKLAD